MINSSGRPGILRANAYYLIAGIGLIALNLISPYLVKAIKAVGMDPRYTDLLLIIDGLYYIPFMLIPVGIHAARTGGVGIRLGQVTFGQMLLSMLLAYLCVLLANAVGGLWAILLEFMGLELYAVDVDINGTADLLKAILAMAVLPGVCEELLFRGTVMTAYERGGTRKAIIISSLMFATLHGSVQGLPVQLIVGLILGCVACYTGSVYTSMMVHTAYNAFILMISYAVPEQVAPEGMTMYRQIGGMFGVIVLAVEAAVVGALVLAILRSYVRKGIESGIEVVPKGRIHMDWTAAVVLISGVVTVCYMYMNDILTLTGY